MLQFIPDNDTPYTPAEQVQMALEGGCQWLSQATDQMDDGAIREAAAEIVPLCREAGAILTLENHPELARELGIHGVLVNGDLSVATIRQSFGGDGIIGAVCRSAASVPALEGMDADYAVLPADMGTEEMARLVSDVRAAGCQLHIVAMGDFDSANCAAVINSGVSGVATGRLLMNAPDPVAAVEALIARLNELRGV